MNYKQLTIDERYQIQAYLKIGLSQKEIASHLERHPSTIGREIKRNTGMRGYRPKQANQFSVERRGAALKAIKLTEAIKDKVKILIQQELSPDQVCFYLEKNDIVKLHHETIYRMVLADKKQQGTLYQHLRHLHKTHRKRYGSYDRRGRIKNAVSIDERPEIVDEKSRIGDWEGDTIIGKDRKSAIYTLVERKTLYTIIVKLMGKNASDLADRAIKVLKPMAEQIHTITYDNGLEFADHERMAKELNAKIYFAHPYSSWERGINENTNGLIRQYFPKGTDFNEVTQEQIDFVMYRLNTRPRKTREGKQPVELFLGKAVDLLAA
ncbi:IS30 family transposase [Thiomicrospira sp. R3]|uniref:IS30 family transposase n=1 Tax=Thiomicrospira sp. R3 TaxID=3035472 RepID=UPI00259B1F22|nr:IS30 family transposase [Thiomicrospira sp. R3]WFE69564.1 IS30 family transposase [Thiomicrospira sp. R3]